MSETPITPESTPETNGTSVSDDLAQLRSRAEEAEQKRDELLALLRQTQADFLNYQKRAASEREQDRLYRSQSLASDLLTPLDNLERAIIAAKSAGDSGALAEGVAATLTQFLDVLKRHGITRIEAQSQPFDPNVHLAVMQKPSSDVEAGTVLEVLQHGYTIHGRVLRPASVIVSMPPATETS